MSGVGCKPNTGVLPPKVYIVVLSLSDHKALFLSPGTGDGSSSSVHAKPSLRSKLSSNYRTIMYCRKASPSPGSAPPSRPTIRSLLLAIFAAKVQNRHQPHVKLLNVLLSKAQAFVPGPHQLLSPARPSERRQLVRMAYLSILSLGEGAK